MEGHTLAVQNIAERVSLHVDQAERMLAALEGQPAVTRDLLLRRMVEAWLADRRTTYRSNV